MLKMRLKSGESTLDWDEQNLKDPQPYSWEGDKYFRGHSPHLVCWSEETGDSVLSLSTTPSRGHSGDRTLPTTIPTTTKATYSP